MSINTGDEANLAILNMAALALGQLCDSLVFVGGCATGLLVTNVRSQPIRVTRDVDLVAQVTSLHEYQLLEKKIAKLGFANDQSTDAPICRWRRGDLIIDLMPSASDILGFHNRWYPLAVTSANPVQLSGGATIKLISAPVFLGTKLEAFKGRGNNDFMASHDLEDVITIIDGRQPLLDEEGKLPTNYAATLPRSFQIF